MLVFDLSSEDTFREEFVCPKCGHNPRAACKRNRDDKKNTLIERLANLRGPLFTIPKFGSDENCSFQESGFDLFACNAVHGNVE